MKIITFDKTAVFMNLFKFPLVRVTIGLIAGILAGFYFSPNVQFGLLVILCGFSMFLLAYFLTERKIINPVFLGIAVFVLSVGIGVFTQTIHNDRHSKKHYFHHISDKEQIINLTLTSKLKPNIHNYRYYADINSVDNQQIKGKVLLHINKNFHSQEPEIGATFLIYSKIIPITFAKNPNQFDYGKYLEKQKVYAQIYTYSVTSKQLKTRKTIFYYTHKIRTKIIEHLRKSAFSEKELAVFHALILGQKQDISPDILQAYQYAGAIHILSVSGLHVGYIYVFLSFILQAFPNHKKGRIYKLFVLLCALWSFAMLAGMTPAIVRAVTMFSFILVGRFTNRNTNVIYTLLVSILFILICDPSFLFDVGFQLSYLALFFIVWAKPILDKFYVPKNKITKYIWDVATVSFSAQMGVLPLSLYYFNQFPTLFIITNLLVLLPLSFFMIYGVFVSVLAFFRITNFYMSKVMEFGIKYINEVSIQIAKFESFVFTDISFNVFMLMAWYLFIFSFFVWIDKQKFINLVSVLTSILILQFVYISKEIEQKNSSEFIIFNKNKATLLALRTAKKITFFTDDFSSDDFLRKGYEIGSFSRITKTDSLHNFYYFNQKKIMIIDNTAVHNENLSPDIVILIGSPKINLERFFQNNHPEIVIADASNYKSRIELWKKTCKKEKIQFHSTYENGFYRIE